MSDEKNTSHGVGDKWEVLPDDGIERFTEILKALANPARLRLVNILSGGEHTVNELCELSGLKQSLVSQQLKILRLNNIVQYRKLTPHTYYSLKDENVTRMLRCLSRCGEIK
jgi:ArsR family transcriptional regulator